MSYFKASARTVEMLGRQQIAGIPTAISEIFKNAHDAYANRVEADYLPAHRLLVIRDDGFGMTEQEFDSRWLTLGTDSKVAGGMGLPPLPQGVPQRVMLGEKGIGRLAVAIIGPQVLILTRAQRDHALGDLVAAFVNWAAFDLPGINLDEIEVPVKVFPSGAMPSASDITALVQASLDNIESFRGRTDINKLREATSNVIDFGVDVSDIVANQAGLKLNGGGHGTQFFISPTDEALMSDLDPPRPTGRPSQLYQDLIGFSNTMTPGHETPALQVVFRNHKSGGLVDDLISASSFFTSEEMLRADHHFIGSFDQYGQYSGVASIYGKQTDYTVPYRNAGSRPLSCGPFKFSLGIIQPRASESRLSATELAQMSAKLEAIGGVYIYKDGVRVLPYGKQDYDYLDIERDRSKGAAYYYYSYRNIFGAVELGQHSNPRLREKAGREGFQDNAAWRDFRTVLKNFFLQSAADFFRAGGLNTALFEAQRSEYKRLDQAKRERERRIRIRRQKFAESLDLALTRMQSGDLSVEIEDVLSVLQHRLADATSRTQSEEVFEAEQEARKALGAIRASVAVPQPRGVALSTALRREWSAYQAEARRLDESLFAPAAVRIASMVSEAASAFGGGVALSRWLSSTVADAAKAAQQATRIAARELDSTLMHFRERVSATRDDLVGRVDTAAYEAFNRARAVDVPSSEQDEVVALSLSLEDQIRLASERARASLQAMTSDLSNTVWAIDQDGALVTQSDITASAEEEILALRERSEQDLDLAQLGMAISVIDHEFQVTIRSIRTGLRRLRAWADLNPKLSPVYAELRTSFDHLDGYLTLFTPLQRRLRRTETEIRGADIFEFVRNLFGDRLEREHVKLDSTPAFRRARIVGYPSTFYPVFVNLLDNAIFWLSDRQDPRKIVLDADGDDFLVSDNGPGVSLGDRDAIFESGFTRKPGGRGLGLSISREAVGAVGYDLLLDRHGKLGGATFRVRKQADD